MWLGLVATIASRGLVMAAAITAFGCKQERTTPGKNPSAVVSSLPYLDYAPVDDKNAGKSGVVVSTDRAWPGLNLYGGRTSTDALLVDMQGRVVKKWSAPQFQRRPVAAQYEFVADWINESRGFTHVELDGHGGIYGNVGLDSLTRMDKDGHVTWRIQHFIHHDIARSADNDKFYALMARIRDVEYRGTTVPIVDDLIGEFDAKTGKKLAEFSIYDLLAAHSTRLPALERNMNKLKDYVETLRQAPQAKRPAAIPTTKLELVVDLLGLGRDVGLSTSEELLVAILTDADILHTNTVEVLPATQGAIWQAGQLLISMRNLHTIAIVDLSTRSLVWAWGDGHLGRQHDPHPLPNGHIVLFDNGWMVRDQSRALQVDPSSNEIVWEYPRAGLCSPSTRNTPEGLEHCFFSVTMGGAQPLPNGNLLITDGRNGRAVEVTPDHKKAWEYFNPTRPRSEDGFIGTIYRVTRVPASACKACD